MSGQDGESLLGSFLWGKFNKYHDIALVKVNDGQEHMSSSDMCSWTEIFPAKKVNKMIGKQGVTVCVEKNWFYIWYNWRNDLSNGLLHRQERRETPPQKGLYDRE